MAQKPQSSGLRLPMPIWDLPIRLFHWLLPVLLLTSYIAVKTDRMALHLLSGWLVSLCPAGTWYRAGVAGIFQTAGALLAVWMLGAWVSIQVDKTPAATKQRRSLT